MESARGLQTHFSAQTLAEVFRDLYLAERCGVLTLNQDDVEKRIYFDRGLIHYADSTLERDDLGRRLVEQKRISQGALDEAKRNIGEPHELVQAMINRGLVSKDAVNETVWDIVRSVVRSVFQWEGGTMRFGEGPEVPSSHDCDVLSTFEVILHGIFEMNGFQAIQEAMLGLDNHLHVREPTPLPLERLTLSPAHGFILSRVDGSTTVRDVVSLVPTGEEPLAARFLFGLLIMGVLEYRPPVGEGPFRAANILRDHADRRALERVQERTIQHVYSQMKEQNPYEILGVTSAASHETVERAYTEAKSLFGRRILPQVREKFRSELAVIESRLIEAYLKLSQVESKPKAEPRPEVAEEDVSADDLLVRVEMDKSRTKLAQEKATKVANAYYNKACQAVREGDYHNAIQYGKLAISYDSEDPRYYYILGECQARNPHVRSQRLAEEHFTRAAELDPWNAEYLIQLGRFYQKQGMKLRARKQFEKALQLAPTHEEAASLLKALG